jgi:hypothetical protein
MTRQSPTLPPLFHPYPPAPVPISPSWMAPLLLKPLSRNLTHHFDKREKLGHLCSRRKKEFNLLPRTEQEGHDPPPPGNPLSLIAKTRDVNNFCLNISWVRPINRDLQCSSLGIGIWAWPTALPPPSSRLCNAVNPLFYTYSDQLKPKGLWFSLVWWDLSDVISPKEGGGRGHCTNPHNSSISNLHDRAAWVAE